MVLGGDMYGNMGLILTATQYTMLSNTPFVCLVNPGPFDPPEKLTKAKINATHDVWKGFHHMFHLSQAVEKARISQVVLAVELPYLAVLLKTNTSQYKDYILTVLHQLFTTYGHSSTIESTRDGEQYELPFGTSSCLTPYSILSRIQSNCLNMLSCPCHQIKLLVWPMLFWQVTLSYCKIWEPRIEVLPREIHGPTWKYIYAKHNKTYFHCQLPIRCTIQALKKISHTSVGWWITTTKCGCVTTNPSRSILLLCQFHSNPATLIEMSNKVQQCAVDLNSCKNKLMAQFQEMLSLLQNANAAHMHLLANSIETKEKMQENNNRSLVSTVGFMGAAHTPELSAITRPTTTRTNLPSTTFWWLFSRVL